MLLQIHEPGEKAPVATPRLNDIAIGIDLGTTHCIVAMPEGETIRLWRDETGEARIPSLIAYNQTQIICGKQALTSSEHIVRSIKRIMGKTYDDLPRSMPQFPYPLLENAQDKDMIHFYVGDRLLNPVIVTSHLLAYVKSLAETALGHEVKQAIITVPAYFNETARAATKEAAKQAGLNVLRMINEPTAAALAYGLDQKAEGTYLVYDLGGGTFDVSCLKLQMGVFQVIATGGNNQLGGDDFDYALWQLCQEKWHALSVKAPDYYHIRTTICLAKEALSEKEEVEIAWQDLPKITVTRKELDILLVPYIEETLHCVQAVLRDAGLGVDDISGVVMVGGSTRIPSVLRAVGQCFGKDPLHALNPDEIVGLGAGLQAKALTRGSDTLLLDVTPLSLGIETMGGLVEKMIFRNTPLPITHTQEFTTFFDNQDSLKIHVVQGESERVDNCRSLGQFVLNNIPLRPAGEPRIQVTFTLDVDGLLSVEAIERITNTKQTVMIKPSYGLDESQTSHLLQKE